MNENSFFSPERCCLVGPIICTLVDQSACYLTVTHNKFVAADQDTFCRRRRRKPICGQVWFSTQLNQHYLHCVSIAPFTAFLVLQGFRKRLSKWLQAASDWLTNTSPAICFLNGHFLYAFDLSEFILKAGQNFAFHLKLFLI